VILEKLVGEIVSKVCSSINAKTVLGKTQSFKPGRPVPTHRYTSMNAK
jgi:hypothetical protein